MFKMLTDYDSRKNEVLNAYNKVQKIITDYEQLVGTEKSKKQLIELIKCIESKAEKVKKEKFKIIVVGESKSGKSTFINAYLGIELLPMDVKQCTSTIVEIKHGDKISLMATYADGSEKAIIGEAKVRDFLKKNVSINDDYRGIPVSAVDRFLVQFGQRSVKKGTNVFISESDVEKFLKETEVIEANIYSYSDYNERIKKYIKKKLNDWRHIVTKVVVTFPLEKSFQGMEFVDSPGVGAYGGVETITSQYIGDADAIIFLKSAVGQSLESKQFNDFLKKESMAKDGAALFLVFTNISKMTDSGFRRWEDEASNQFSGKIKKNHILFVDSQAALYAKRFSNFKDKGEIIAELKRMNNMGSLDPYINTAYSNTLGDFGDGDVEDFLERLRDKSGFQLMKEALTRFGRKTNYILFAALLDSISKLYGEIQNMLHDDINISKDKAERLSGWEITVDKLEDKKKINRERQEKTKAIVDRYFWDTGIIRRMLHRVVLDYMVSCDEFDPRRSDSFYKLQKLTLQKIDELKNITEKIQQQIVEEFDDEFIKLSNKEWISYKHMKSPFSEETFNKIKEENKESGYERGTSPKTKENPVYFREQHFVVVRNEIYKRLRNIEDLLVDNLELFVKNIGEKYSKELANDIRAKEDEYAMILSNAKDAIEDARKEKNILPKLEAMAKAIRVNMDEVDRLKGGIEKII